MMLGSLASNASGSASATVATRLIHSNWVGAIGSNSSFRPVAGSSRNGKKMTAAIRIIARPRLVGRTKTRDLMRLS